MTIEDFTKSYILKIKNLLESVDCHVIEEIIIQLESCEKRKGNLYLLGNGGSAATASHMANDLNVGLRRRKIKNLNALSLADNTAVVTAIANDIGYENVFYAQLEGLLTEDDLIIALSCSGNSENILKAVRYANQLNCKVISCTGGDGGKLKAMSDIQFHVESKIGEFGPTEDIHMILDHIIYSYFLQQGQTGD